MAMVKVEVRKQQPVDVKLSAHMYSHPIPPFYAAWHVYGLYDNSYKQVNQKRLRRIILYRVGLY